MRLHELRLEAFGPFARQQVVDFDALSAAGVFVLTGPTGAGKTSVLDAVCFALYGQVPGIRDRAKAFHSHHGASAGLAPRVVLELTVQGRRLRVSRSAAWRRPSRRASLGYVDVPAKALLEEHGDAGWFARSARLDEVGLTLRALLGLDRDQFCQVVMLPQGEFQTFLRAGGRDRQQILETLFGTQRFQAVERWLAERRRVTARELAARTQSLRELVTRIDEALRPWSELLGPFVTGPVDALPDATGGGHAQAELLSGWASASPGWTDVPSDAIVDLVHHALLTCTDARGRATDAAADSAALAKHAQHALDEARLLAERQESVRQARRRRDALDALQPVVDQRAERIAAATEAMRLRGLLDAVTESRRLRDVAALRLDRAWVAVAQVDETAVPEADRATVPGVEALRRALVGMHAKRDELALLTGRLAALAHVHEQLRDAERELRETVAATSAIEERLREADVTLQRIAAELDRLSADLGPVGAVDEALTAAESALAAAHEAADCARQLVTLERRLRLADVAERDSAAAWSVARSKLARGIAAELARGLVPGEPCPVCGGAEHPAPATPTRDHVSSANEAELFGELEACRGATLEAERAVAAMRLRHAAASTRAGGLDVPGAMLARDEAATVVTSTRAAEARRAVLSQERHQLTEAVAAVLATRDDRLSARARADERRAQLQAAHQRERTALVADLGAPSTSTSEQLSRLVEDESRRVEDTSTVVEAALRAAEALAQRADDAARDERRLSASLEDSLFETEESARAAVLAPTALADLETLQRVHLSESTAVDRLLAEPRHLAAAALPVPDLEQLAAGCADAATAARADQQLADRLDATVERLAALGDEIELAVAQLRPIEQEHRLADAVAGLCAGTSPDNPTRTALSHYVLATRFGQVVDAANVRLRSICDGRYRLVHTFDKGAGDTRGGLGLRMLDASTDRERDPATLSGGETFYVSLSLALGLADVVTEESTGAELATLFVDEGFGALDETTREEVLDELDALRAGGRTIGLVSHLPELRDRFPAQLRVAPGPLGSTCSATVTG